MFLHGISIVANYSAIPLDKKRAFSRVTKAISRPAEFCSPRSSRKEQTLKFLITWTDDKRGRNFRQHASSSSIPPPVNRERARKLPGGETFDVRFSSGSFRSGAIPAANSFRSRFAAPELCKLRGEGVEVARSCGKRLEIRRLRH